MLIDQAKIYVSGGKGGDGCQSVYKDLYHRRGIPDGGDGGPGGDVLIQSTSNLNTLLDLKYQQHYYAEKGTNGGSNKKYGKKGKDITIQVPIGTIVKDLETNLIIRDLALDKEKVIVAKGGIGGKGSAKKIETETQGQQGISRTLLLELKLVADVGLIGLPNAGKSTLVCKLSKSHSKIAPYPFTTKNPKLGVVDYHDNTFVIADMPGLVEGAHKGRGLGDRFLKHIERTSVLVHVIDMMPLDEKEPFENYITIEKELELYNKKVFDKPRIIVANKMDLPEAMINLKSFQSKINKKIFPISALDGQGLKELTKEIFTTIQNIRGNIC